MLVREESGFQLPLQLSCKGNVATEFRIKGDDTRKVWMVAKYGQINPTRMIKYGGTVVCIYFLIVCIYV